MFFWLTVLIIVMSDYNEQTNNYKITFKHNVMITCSDLHATDRSPTSVGTYLDKIIKIII